jgi:predicted ATPase
MKIQQIKISGFKSIANLSLSQLSPYSVFAGSNGAGKSNLADSLAFLSLVIQSGANAAIRKFNGYPQLHCYKLRGNSARTFEFSITATIAESCIDYTVKVHDMDTQPALEEKFLIDGMTVMLRKKGEPPQVQMADDNLVQMPNFPSEMSGLMLLPQTALYQYLINIRVFRFDPLGAKEPDASSTDGSELSPFGHNVATILAALEKNSEIRSEIIDWMELIVPGMEHVVTEQQRLDGRTIIKFKEEGTKAHFPANLISDGTIYALCIMAAVLSRAKGYGLTLIEEPERGIHPKAIAELVRLMRDNASTEHPVLVTTHSESLVRACTKEELWLVNKEDGKTVVKNAAQNCVDLGTLNLDTAWLMNFFDGGLPW